VELVELVAAELVANVVMAAEILQQLEQLTLVVEVVDQEMHLVLVVLLVVEEVELW
jgi:hypothetical protein